MRFLSTLVASALGTLVALGVLFLFLFLFVLAFAFSSDATPAVTAGSTLVVEVDGAIPERVARDPFTESFTTQTARYDLVDLKNALEKAAVDERIAGVWLRLKGTSAGWATLNEARAALMAYKASGKPLVASSEDFGMTEKTYYLASAADHIFASPQAPFEFNGFYINSEFYKQALDKLEVEPQIVRAGKYKSAVEPFLREDLSAPNRAQLEALLATQSDQFIEAVSASRNLDRTTLTQLAEASAILNAESAVDAGLLDSLAYHDQVIDFIQQRYGNAPDEELTTTSVSRYASVPFSEVGLSPSSSDEIAVVYAEGQIVTGSTDDVYPLGGGSGMIGSTTFNEAMREARTEPSVRAILLRVNSPGGSVAASEAMWREVALASEAKPVIVSMGNLAASGGYYIAAPAETIVADPQTLTGSIGVFGLFFDAGGLFENKLGVTFDAVRTSPYADIFSGVRPLSENERRLLETSVDATYEQFLGRVAEGRGMTPEAVDAIGQGRVWTGADALDVGLVDTLGTLDDALSIAAERADLGEGPYRVRILPKPKTFFDRLNESLYTEAARLWTEATTSPAERALLQQRRTLQQLAREHGTVQARLPQTITIE